MLWLLLLRYYDKGYFFDSKWGDIKEVKRKIITRTFQKKLATKQGRKQKFKLETCFRLN